MRYVGIGAAMLAGVVGLVVYAARDDPYYGGGVSRWEHAEGAQGLVLAAFGVASVLALGVVALGVAGRRVTPAPLLVFGALPAYLAALVFAWFFLSVGH
jgi:hypothetical protein